MIPGLFQPHASPRVFPTLRRGRVSKLSKTKVDKSSMLISSALELTQKTKMVFVMLMGQHKRKHNNWYIELVVHFSNDVTTVCMMLNHENWWYDQAVVHEWYHWRNDHVDIQMTIYYQWYVWSAITTSHPSSPRQLYPSPSSCLLLPYILLFFASLCHHDWEWSS